jgi:hypothetical protein
LNVLALAPEIAFISAGSASTFMALLHNTAEKALSGGNLKESKNDSGTQSDEERENELFLSLLERGHVRAFEFMQTDGRNV